VPLWEALRESGAGKSNLQNHIAGPESCSVALGGEQKMTRERLTEKQRRGLEYAKDCNAAAAARRAGYAEDCAKETGYRLLQTPHVKAAAHRAVKKHLDALNLSLERICQELALSAGPRRSPFSPSQRSRVAD